MKFTDWYNKFYEGCSYNSDCYHSSEAAWIASKNHLKQEVLEILNDNKRNCMDTDTNWIEYIRASVIEEIKRL